MGVGAVIDVEIIGDGQLARGIAQRLATRPDIRVGMPTPRAGIAEALRRGAPVVIIATTTRLADVSTDIERAVLAGSNVIVSAEECAFPWAVDPGIAERLDALAVTSGVTILGCGLNPGFVFDALVLTLLGTTSLPSTISVERRVDLSGFGPAVRARLGLHVSRAEFEEGIAHARILGHAGFPQSMSIVARALGLSIERIDTSIRPILDNGLTVGVEQEYLAVVEGEPWFRALFVGHLSPAAAGLVVRDTVEIRSNDSTMRCAIDPGVGAQAGSQSIIANSIDRVLAARPGWLTVADLEPAHPRLTGAAPSTQPSHPTPTS